MRERKECEDYTVVYMNEDGMIYTEPELITKFIKEGEFETREDALKNLRIYWSTNGYYEMEISDAIYQALRKTYG